MKTASKNNIKKSSYKHLSLKERQLIEVWHNMGDSNREIGRRLGRHHQTINNELKRGFLPVRNHHLKMKVRLSPKKKRSHKHKKALGKSIDERPSKIDSRKEFDHGEIDSVIGSKSKDDNTLLTLVERKTLQYDHYCFR